MHRAFCGVLGKLKPRGSRWRPSKSTKSPNGGIITGDPWERSVWDGQLGCLGSEHNVADIIIVDISTSAVHVGDDE